MFFLIVSDNPSLIFIQYLFDGEVHSVDLTTHGNSKSSEAAPYVRTKDSTRSRLQDACNKKTPKSAYHQIAKENGGVRNASSASDLPRNKDQAKYARRIVQTPRHENIDSLIILLVQCKRQQLQRDEEPFIREVTGAPEMKCVLGYDWQITNLITFCSDPNSFTILGVDPTFNLGRFNVTVTTFENLKVVDRKTEHNPIMIGPLLLSQTKAFDAYNFFFSKVS